MYNDLMLAPSGLSKLEREMIATAVSAQNRCYYCITAHGAAVRALPATRARRTDGDELSRRAAFQAPARHARFRRQAHRRALGGRRGDRERLRRVGFTDRDIWDIAAVAASTT